MSEAPAVTRAIAILRLLSESREPLGVSAIARAAGLIPSTCLHILRALAEEDLVRVDASAKRYAIGPGMLALARPLLRRSRFGEAVQPGLERVARELGVSAVGMRVFGLDRVAVVAIAHSDRPWHLHLDLGDVFPALTSATGRCVAAFGGFKRDELAHAFAKTQWENPPSPAAWFEQVEDAKRRGYAIDDANFTTGVMVLSAPVVTHQGELQYVVSVAGIREQIEAAGIDKVGAALLELARSAGEHLDSSRFSSQAQG